ncbi:MAG TPA: G1 family glutamic endopeptidase [Acidimicrobiales bacterium]|nr:G1 family glutamic endopeptidase [Acidimicrobiales bacterium]
MRPGTLMAVPIVALASMAASTSGAAAPAASADAVQAPRIAIPEPTPTPGPEASFARTVHQTWASRNWSGYAITGSRYTSVSGTWTVPTVNTPPKKAQRRRDFFSGTWVGVDGFTPSSHPNLIQAGTEQDYLKGHTFYQAWWEILPAAETPIPSVPVHAGDSVTVTITQGSPTWTLTLTDNTTHQSFTTTRSYSGPRTSVEWIQEAPSVNRRVANLAYDSTFSFDHALVNGSPANLVTSESGVMFKGRTQISTPSAPDADRDGFSVAHGAIAPSPPPS